MSTTLNKSLHKTSTPNTETETQRARRQKDPKEPRKVHNPTNQQGRQKKTLPRHPPKKEPGEET